MRSKGKGRIKRIISVFICAFMLLGSISSQAFATNGTEIPEGYTPILTIDDLNNIRNDLDGNYILMNDLDLSEATSENGIYSYNKNGWLPIGCGSDYSNEPFSGVFDGNGHTISGININASNSGITYNGYFGLFANNSGTIKDLELQNPSIINQKFTGTYIGTLVGYNSGTVSNITITNGSVTSNQYYPAKYVGGVVGYNTGEINNVKTVGGNIDVDGYGYCIGGIVGCNEKGNIVNCSNSNNIDAYGYFVEESPEEDALPTYIDKYKFDGVDVLVYEYKYLISSYRGGIAGRLTSGGIQNCFNTASITGDIKITSSSSSGLSLTGNGSYQEIRKTYVNKYIAAGIVGKAEADYKISNCYNTGEISCKSSNTSLSAIMSGIVAEGGEVVSCYNIGDILIPSEYKECDIYPIGGAASNCYYLQNDTTKTQTGASSLSKVQFTKMSFMPGLDFDNVWIIDSRTDYAYPQLLNNRQSTEIKIDKIEIKDSSLKSTYSVGDEIDVTDGILICYYSSGATEEIAITKEMLSGYDLSVEGEQEITVTYSEKSTKFKINVEAVSLVGIEVVEPTKKSYVIGDEADWSGMVVTAKYSNGTEKIVSDYSIDGFTGNVGINNITINYGSYNYEFAIVIHELSEEWVVTKEPTCQEEGKRVKRCLNCNEIVQEEQIDKSAHVYGDWSVLKEATCSETGLKSKKCKYCNSTIEETIPIVSHSYIENVIKPTCTEDGFTLYLCEACGDSYVVVDNNTATGHTYGKWITDKEPTCTEDGHKYQECVCGEMIFEMIEATGHSFDVEYVEKLPTCTEDGQTFKKCSFCDTIDEHSKSILKAQGHTWEEDYTVDKEATNTEDGSKSIHCSVCDAKNEDTITTILATSLLARGNCGENASWSLSKEGVLEITGTGVIGAGELEGFTYTEDQPWYNYANEIKAVKVGEGITKIGFNSFSDFNALKEVSLPSTLTVIGMDAFNGCSGLESINLPNGLLEIGSGAFSGCASLVQITVPSTVTSIGDSAFYRCSNLIRIFIPKNVKSIGPNAFSSSNALVNIHYEGSEEEWNKISNYSAEDYGIYRFIFNSKGSTAAWSFEDGVLTISGNGRMDSYNNYSDSPWWSIRNEIKKIVIEEGITHIGQYAFYDTNNLEEIVIADTVEKIGGWAFASCDSLYAISIPENITALGSFAFEDCASLETVTFRGAPTIIEDCVFSNNSSTHMTYYVTPGTMIHEYLFTNCKNDNTSIFCLNENHDYSDTWTEDKEATCTETGSKHKECKNCDAIKTVTTDKLGHSWSNEFTVDKEASCTEDGSKSIHCSICDTKKDITVIEKKAHEYGDWIVDKEPSCTEAGSKHKTCLCGDIITKEIPTTGHDWDDGENAFNIPVCKDGVWRFVCKKCSAIDYLEVTAKPHDYSIVETIKPTCTEKGWTLYTCSICKDNSYSANYVDALGHSWNKDFTVDKEASCTEEGSKSIHCSVCDVTKDVTVIEKKKHEYGSWTIDKEPTCTETGSKHKVCTCGDTTTEEIPAKGHFWNKDFTVDKVASCTEEGSKSIHCSVCDARKDVTVIEKASHEYGKWNIDKEATCTEAGSKYKECFCGDKVAEEIRATGHSEVVDPAIAPKCETTGLTEGSHCAKCGEVFIAQEVINATGHNYKKVVTEPTCKEKGYTTYTCTCGDSYISDEKDALGHDIKITYNNKSHTEKCSRCEHDKTSDCTFDEGVVTKEASKNEDGVKTFTCTVCGGTYTEPIKYIANIDENVYRIAGNDRFATSLKAADVLKADMGVSKFDNIVIASGMTFADALPGSYLAAEKSAPILLIGAGNYTTIKNYVNNNLKSGGTVYVLGGAGVVLDSWVSGMPNVQRLGGQNRYETNLKILDAAGVDAGSDILVCTGANFADSLSASATGKPILLVGGSLNEAQKSYLNGLTDEQYFMIGGIGAVSDAVMNECSIYGTVSRVAGSNRYATSVEVAKTFFDKPDYAVLAYGLNFPDGLSAGPLAYNLDSPLILTATGSDAQAAEYAKSKGIKYGYVIGGSGLISDGAVRNVFQMNSSVVINTK